MRYGTFDDTQKEYVITRPDTPVPWSNYIGNEQFGGLVTNNGIGYTFYKSAAQGRLTRYRFNEHAAAQPGRFVYLLDRDSGDFWSNIWQPVAKPLDQFEAECRHGSGYSIVKAGYSGIESEVTTFVPQNAAYELWKITVTNTGDMPCAALQTDLDLAPGESRTFAALFGVRLDEASARNAIAAFDTAEKMDAALAEVKAFWHSRLGRLHVETPDAEFNALANMWAPFNNLMTFYWSRTASMVYAGERDGLGYRDTVQDIVGASSILPDEALERLELMLTGQYANGGAVPVVKPFAHNPGSEGPPPSRSDDCMWLFNAVPAYVKESGDISFYRKVLPFGDQGEGTVLEHLRRAIEFNIERSGAHGLPCGLFADWNDYVQLGEKGETVFVAMQLRYALREYIEISSLLSESAEADVRQVEPYAVCQSTHSTLSPRFGTGRFSKRNRLVEACDRFVFSSRSVHLC